MTSFRSIFAFAMMCVLSFASLVLGDVETEPRRPKVDPASYPYGKPKEAIGAKISEFQALAVPTWLLIVVMLVFVAGAGAIIYKIFDSESQKVVKEQEKLAAREEKRAAKALKGSKKGSKKGE